MRSILPIGTQPYIHCSVISLVPTRLEIWKPHFSGSFVALFQLDCASGNPRLKKVGGRKESLCFWQGLFRRKFRSSGSTLANREAVTAASAIQTLAALAPSADLWVPPPCSLGNTFSAFCSFKSRPVVVSWSLGNCFPSYASSDLPHNFVTNSLLLNPPLRLMCGRNQHNIVKQLSSN